MKNPYDDIIHLPRHVSATRPQMSRENRAAQFSPFAALTGYEAAVKETARLTDRRIELGESAVAELDLKFQILAEHTCSHPEITVTYFQPDTRKDGGRYVTVSGTLKRLDDHERNMVLMTGEKIAIEDIYDIEGALFEKMGSSCE